MTYLLALVVDGVLSGVVNALIAMALIVVYRISGLLDLARGEWLLLASLLMATIIEALGPVPRALALPIAIAVAMAATVVLSSLFVRGILTHLAGRPAVISIMVTLGLGAVVKGFADLFLRGASLRIELDSWSRPIEVLGVTLLQGKLAAALAALGLIGAFHFVDRRSRLGVAMRAVADNPTVAAAMGIDVPRVTTIVWSIAAALTVVTAFFWLLLAGGGHGLVLLGLDVLPIAVIGGLTSMAGALAAAVLLGLVRGLVTGYVDPWLGAGFGGISTSLLLLAVLLVRPDGLFGQRPVQRV